RMTMNLAKSSCCNKRIFLENLQRLETILGIDIQSMEKLIDHGFAIDTIKDDTCTTIDCHHLMRFCCRQTEVVCNLIIIEFLLHRPIICVWLGQLQYSSIIELINFRTT